MIGGRPSLTAELVAWMRATETQRPAPARIVDDPWAERFLSPPLALALAAWRASGRLAEVVQQLSPGLVVWVLCRHRWIDDRLAEAIARGCRQVAILGAGYDTRAQRFASTLGGATVFELDFPATSDRKARILRDRRAELPAVDLRRLAIDFTTERVADRLIAGGYATSAASFFVWEGVSMYLSRAAAAATLSEIHRLGAVGSELVADFWSPPPVFDLQGAAVRMAGDALAFVGEPLTFGLALDEAPAFLTESGFTVREIATADELARRYVRDGRPVFPGSFVASLLKAGPGAG